MKLLVLMGGIFLTIGQLIFPSDNSKYNILKEYIIMHNDGSESAIRLFINTHHHPDDLRSLNIEKHINFYNHIIEEFGPLNPEVYKVEEENSTKLIVNLIKQDDDVRDKEIDPVDILQVEIDVYKGNPSYLSRGIGLGALACSIRD